MSAAATATSITRPSRTVEIVSKFVFIGLHLSPLLAIWTGVSLRAVLIGIALYWSRMFLITAGYHRYFSHRSFKTSRWFQFVLAFLGTACVQKGPIWWASTHRRHHKFSDTPEDVHSPVQRGFWYSHIGWIAANDHTHTDHRWVKDMNAFPELRWLGRYYFVAPVLLAIGCLLAAGWSGLVVGFLWSTIVLWHCTWTINSLSHVFGKRRYATTDTSRNNWFLALVTMGEGWHNNHHHYMNSANQGFFWWEIDVSYYILRGMAAVGLIWDLKKPPKQALVKDLIVAAPKPVVEEAAPPVAAPALGDAA